MTNRYIIYIIGTVLNYSRLCLRTLSNDIRSYWCCLLSVLASILPETPQSVGLSWQACQCVHQCGLRTPRTAGPGLLDTPDMAMYGLDTVHLPTRGDVNDKIPIKRYRTQYICVGRGQSRVSGLLPVNTTRSRQVHSDLTLATVNRMELIHERLLQMEGGREG